MPSHESRDPYGGAVSERGSGWLATAAALLVWGVLPAFWAQIEASPQVIVAHRVIWSAAIAWTWLVVSGRLRAVLRDGWRHARWSVAAASLIGVNWFVYVYGIATNQSSEVGMGYYAYPIVGVLLGVVFFGEALGIAGWMGIAVVASGLALASARATFSPVAVLLAVTFAAYNAVRKKSPLRAFDGLGLELLILLPFAALALVAAPDADRIALQLVATGPATIVPMLLYTIGVRALPLTQVSLAFYLVPTMMVLVSVFGLGEVMDAQRVLSMALIVFGVLLVVLARLWTVRRRTPEDVKTPRE